MKTQNKKQALIVIAHPDENSLTHAIATALTEGIRQKGHDVILADLMAEGFDPRFTLADNLVSQTGGTPPADIIFEQQRVESADALLLVFPVYWWSFPALLKGWLDRVMTNGWAYSEGSGGQLLPKLTHLKVHLCPLAWAPSQIYEQGGYRQAMSTQINQGFFAYIGTEIIHDDLFHLEDGADILLERARHLGRQIFMYSEFT